MLLSQRPLTGSPADEALRAPLWSASVAAIHRAIARGQNSLILGRRRTGRTTLLLGLKHDLEVSGVPVVLVDASPWEEPRDLLEAILAGLGADARPDSRTVMVPGFSLGMMNPMGPREVTVRRPMNEQDLARLSAVGQRNAGTVVLLDNLDGDVGFEIFGRFRDVTWMAGLIWVASGDQDDASLVEPPADTFWETRVVLGSLDPSQVLDMVERRVRAAVAGDPDIQLVNDRLEEIVRQLRAPGAGDVMAALRSVVEGEDGAIVAGDPVRASLARTSAGSAGERLLYEIDALGRPAHAGDAELLQAVGISRPRVSQLFKALEGAGLLRSFDQGRRKLYEPVPLP